MAPGSPLDTVLASRGGGKGGAVEWEVSEA